MTRRLLTLVVALIACTSVFPPLPLEAAAGARVLGRVQVSEDAGLGRIELHENLAAVLQRDEGVVALVDVGDPRRPKVLGRYSDNARQSLDGDLVFSSDGRWLVYARQTRQFWMEGIHVLDVSDPTAPTPAFYQPAGGTLRIAHHDDGSREWIVVMDAILGMVVYAFDATTGALVPVHVDAMPALKVGGPASAGLVIQRDPMLDKTLLYASTGRTGVDVYDFSDPTRPELQGAWRDVGLAELEVRASGRSRTIYAATEYWFDKSRPPEVLVLNASKLDHIRRSASYSSRRPADPQDRWRVQGMALLGRGLLAAHSEAGLVEFRPGGVTRTVLRPSGARNDGAGVVGRGGYSYDVETHRGLIFVTDAATGTLTIARR